MEQNKTRFNLKAMRKSLLFSLLGLVLFLIISYIAEQAMVVILYLIITVGYCLKAKLISLNKWVSSIILLGLKACVVLLFLMLFRAFVYDVYKIPSGSMEQSLCIGDKIIVKKHWRTLIKSKIKVFPDNDVILPIHNDIYVFFPPNSKRTAYVKRVIGLPGDTISCNKNQVSINSCLAKDYSTYQWRYRLLTTEDIDIRPILDALFHRRVAVQSSDDPNKFFAYISLHETRLLKEAYPGIAQWRVNIKRKTPSRSYPWSELVAGSFDNFGPVVVPQKGMLINLTPEHIAWYADIIRRENENVYNEDSIVLINNKVVSNYTFKGNYYFMMGDNRCASLDSRSWGFAPEERLIGKVYKKVRDWKLLDIEK